MAELKDKRARKFGKIFAKNLTLIRERRGFDMREAELVTRINRSQLHRYESGETSPHVGLVKIMADAYEVSVDYFYLETLPWKHEFKEPTANP